MMRPSRLSDFRAARRVRAFNRTVQIVLGLCLVILVNVIAARYFQRVDLTESGVYTLAPESKAYLRQLDKPVKIIVTIPENPDSPELRRINNDLRKLLREYEFVGRVAGNPMVDVEFVDIYQQRSRAQELANRYDLTQENVILVASGDRTRKIRQADLYKVQDGKITAFKGEQAFTQAILAVASDEPSVLYFLVGHGEMRLDDVDPLRGLSQLETFLAERGFQPATLDLASADAVPENADMVLVPSPQAALLPEEVEKLRRYMSDRNGRMMVFLDPGRKHGMDDLLFDWGVLADDMAIFDEGPDYKASGGDFIIRRFAQHPITEFLIDYKITALFGQPRPVRKDPAARNDERLKVTQLIGSSETSWAERDYRTQEPPQYDVGRDIQGPVPIATVSKRSAGAKLGITIPGGRFAVFGNSDFIANNRLSAFGNRTLFFNTLNWALDRTEMLNIPSRPMESYQIVMGAAELRKLLLYFGIAPGAVALLGLLVYGVRRR